MLRSYIGASSALLAASPVPVAVAAWVHGADVHRAPPWVTACAALAFVCLATGALLLPRKPRVGSAAVTAGLAGTLAVATPALEASPALTLAALLGLIAALSALWLRPLTAAPAMSHPRTLVVRARAACLAALGLWLVTALVGKRAGTLADLSALGLSLLIAITRVAQWARHQHPHQPTRARILAGAAAVALLGVVLGLLLTGGQPMLSLSALAVLPAVALLILPPRPHTGIEHVDWWEPILDHPERLLVATFFALCVVATLLLSLPASSTTGERIGIIDAAFTAVSAVCVTGLAVLDTPTDFTAVGQAILLIAIQLGGLGIMTFSTAAMRLLGRRMSLRHEGAVAGLISPHDRSQLYTATRRLILFTAAVEAAGAAALTALFLLHGDDLGPALWRGLFTSISAFCNAGFALQSSSLVPYQAAPAVLHAVALLIIAGSLSPAAVLAVPALARRSVQPVPAQIKLALGATAALLLAGFAGVLAFEWQGALSHLPFADRLHNAWFQSVTLRTAGFNAMALETVQPATLTMMTLWMFIGGSPGGTAGGVKTTTVAVLVLAVVSAVRGRWQIHAFGRRIPHKTVYEAAAIVTVAGAAVLAALIALQLTQAMPTRLAVFEVVSALGTAGLTIGGTGALDGVGKVIIIGCMFIGRVGSLTLFMFLSHRTLAAVWKLPEEEIEVG